MRKQYYFKKSKKGFFAWDVDRLLVLSKDFEVFQIDISAIKEFDEPYWYQEASDVPTCKSVTEHMKLVLECDLQYPIILASNGSVMDGMHRVCKAYLNGQTALKAVRFENTPAPDFEDVHPKDLYYDR